MQTPVIPPPDIAVSSANQVASSRRHTLLLPWLLLLLCCCMAARAAEVWIRPDGPDNTGSGTAADPYVRSTATSFDTLMSGGTIPPYSTIRLMPGTFHTLGITGAGGQFGFQMKDGWKVRGAGMEVTTIVLDEMTSPPAPGVAWSVIGGVPFYDPSGAVHDAEVSDLTVDMNVQNQHTANAGDGVRFGAVSMAGSNTRISRVRVDNWGSTALGAENFLLNLGNHGNYVTIAENCVIEDCVIGAAAQVMLKDGVSAINIAGGPFAPHLNAPGPGWISGAEIRGCFISHVQCAPGTGGIGQPSYFNGVQAAAATVGGKVTGNYVVDVGVGGCATYIECGSSFDYVVENNMFLDVHYGFYMQGWTGCTEASTVRKNHHIRNNLITVKTGGAGIAYGGMAGVSRPSGLTIQDNVIHAVEGAGAIAGIGVSATDKVTIQGNTVDANGGNGISIGPEVTPIRVDGNRDLNGMLVSSVGYPVAAEEYEVKFTPAQAGWYRLVTAGNFHSGTFNISGTFDNSITDLEFTYSVPWVASAGNINLIRHLNYGANITKIRISNDPWNGGGQPVYVDVYVPWVNVPAPLTVTWQPGTKHPGQQQFAGVTYLGATAPPADQELIMDVSRGFHTLGPIYAGSANTRVTDDAGKVRTEALNIVAAAQGGLGADNSARPANQFPYTTGTGQFQFGALTPFSLGLLDDASAGAAQSTLSLVPGTHVQPFSARLTDIAGLTIYSGGLMVGNGTTWGSVTLSGDASLNSAGALTIANNAITTAKIAPGAVNLASSVSGNLPIARLNGGGASASTFWRGDGTWAAAGGRTIVRKITDEAVSSDNVLSADAVLKFTMSANTKYSIRLKVFFSTASSPDFKYRITGPASPALVRRHITRGAGGAVPAMVAIGTAYDAADVALTGSGADGVIDEEIIIHNGANAGDLVFRWAQNTSNTAATTVRAGSYLEHLVH